LLVGAHRHYSGERLTRQAAEILSLPHATVKHAVRRGAIQAEQVAHRSLISRTEIERYARPRHRTIVPDHLEGDDAQDPVEGVGGEWQYPGVGRERDDPIRVGLNGVAC
jgi:hypothetical protein